MKELTCFLWTLTRREESEREKNKVSSHQTLMGNSSLSVLLLTVSAKSIVLPSSLPYLFNGQTMKAKGKEKRICIAFLLLTIKCMVPYIHRKDQAAPGKAFCMFPDNKKCLNFIQSSLCCVFSGSNSTIRPVLKPMPSCHWARGGIHPGQVTSLLQD